MAIHFICPSCGAKHERGYVDGVSTFRCLSCGYLGHGFHADPEIDRDVYADHLAGNAINHAAGIPEEQLPGVAEGSPE
jgi:hypothetical protein